MLSGMLLFNSAQALLLENQCQNNHHWGLVSTPECHTSPEYEQLVEANTLSPNPAVTFCHDRTTGRNRSLTHSSPNGAVEKVRQQRSRPVVVLTYFRVRSARPQTCGLAGPGSAKMASHRRAGLFEQPPHESRHGILRHQSNVITFLL